MQGRDIDVEEKAKELGFDYPFIRIAIETYLMYKESEDKRKEIWDRVVWVQYFNKNVANFKRGKTEPDKLNSKLRVAVEKSFQPLDLNKVDEKSRATLIEFTRGEEIMLYHAYALQSASHIYFEFKKKFNNMFIMDFVRLHFGDVQLMFDKDNYTN